MAKILEFPRIESVRYTAKNGDIAVISKIANLSINNYWGELNVCDGDGWPMSTLQPHNRKELAEFLWASAYLLDSEGRHRADEYPALDYDNGEIKSPR